MGLACAQIRLLSLTERKADCEYGISINSMEKMALSREMTELSQEYYSKLQSKQICYFANGQYNKMNYSYLMGPGSHYTQILDGTRPFKDDNSMILTDYNGRVVMSDDYVKALTAVLGVGAMDDQGRGGTFSLDQIPAILSKLTGLGEDKFKTVIEGGNLTSAYDGHSINTMTGEETGEKTTTDTSSNTTELIQKLVDAYYSIFAAAANNGWTCEYNKEMATNDNYISDALVSGSFQLATVNNMGEYDEGGTLTYFLTAGLIEARSDSDVREEITAWYNAEKDRINEKETFIDLETDELSTELEAINTEIQSIKSFIDDATSSVFDWGSG